MLVCWQAQKTIIFLCVFQTLMCLSRLWKHIFHCCLICVLVSAAGRPSHSFIVVQMVWDECVLIMKLFSSWASYCQWKGRSMRTPPQRSYLHWSMLVSGQFWGIPRTDYEQTQTEPLKLILKLGTRFKKNMRRIKSPSKETLLIIKADPKCTSPKHTMLERQGKHSQL